MKTLLTLINITLFSYFLPFSVFAIHDIAAINVTPTNHQVQFCFDLDTHSPYLDKLYIAAITEEGNIFTIQPTSDSFTLRDLSTEPALIFSEWQEDSEPTCLGPFEKTSLQNMGLYAGVGFSIDDVIQNQNYTQFFNGFLPLPQTETTWTVMVYVVGSDLEESPYRKGGHHWASKDLQEMLQGSSQAPPNSTNLIISTGGSTRNGWQTVKRTFIQNGQQYVLEDLGAKSMADPQTLSDFVIWAKANFPAQHYALILWNHGAGTDGYGVDTSEIGNYNIISLSELHQAYQTIQQQSNELLDVVVYDACLMASIEIAEVTATVAKAMAGSAELEPGHGLDYAHLLKNIGTNPPNSGIDFGSVVKTGYIQHTKDMDTFASSQITYSVFDLTQMKSFSNTFRNFAIEFKNVLKTPSFFDYERLTNGIIRAPGYPFMETGRLDSLDNSNIRIDLYNILQTVGPDFPEFKVHADELLTILDKMVVDYEGNIADIDPNAGRVSIDIGNDKSYLTALPEAYTLLNDGLVFYDERRQEDGFIPQGELICPSGLICAASQWLELVAKNILGIETYFGQKDVDISKVYLIEPDFYQHQELTETLKLGVDGHQACQYQLCVNDSQCEDITLTKQGNQLLADVSLNDSPTVLSFCNSDDQWLACGVAQQINGIWGRNDLLYFEDSIVPSTLHIQASKTELRQGNTLIVNDPVNVSLKKSCDTKKAAIWATYYGLNQQNQIEILCDSGGCVCEPDDTDPGCKEIGFKAGVYLTK